MSADSPNQPRTEKPTNMENTVTPQPVTDPTILDSVAGFIHDVVPTTNNDVFDIKDQIQWVRFENLDENQSNSSVNNEAVTPSNLLLILGYTVGIQVWVIPRNGEASELFSWRHGCIKVLKILPKPYEVGNNKIDIFELKRPLIALVDVSSHGSSSAALNFYSLKTSEQVKQIKFKNQILDVLANNRSVVITFPEKVAVFDAFTLEDKLSVTTCYLSPGLQQNPVALGARWLAYADKKLIISRKTSGGNEGEGVQSYTATVLHAAKSLGRGLKELSDAVTSSLTGNQMCKLGTSPNSPQAGGSADRPQKGIVTILDIENSSGQNADGSFPSDALVAHFVAHSEAIVWLKFGPCGMLLLTADKRGHDFNLFRINPHPLGSALASVHHLYTLHRGDTSAKVQDMCFSFDSRWVTVSTLRGTTHVFPITPYGGNIGVRTHTKPHVVNKMSRFHRSAGLTAEGRSNSPVSMLENPATANFPYRNQRIPPFPQPTIINALAQLRQPLYMQSNGNNVQRQTRQRTLSSSSTDDNVSLRIVACFAPERAWIGTSPLPNEKSLKKDAKPVDSLFIMTCYGTLLQYDLSPHYANSVPKERVCDDSPIELNVIAKAQWNLQRQVLSVDRPLPVPHEHLIYFNSFQRKVEDNIGDEDWVSQIEIMTHAGPHRRLWMGPQFTFKTFTTTSGKSMQSLADAQPLDINRSKPLNTSLTKTNALVIESSSASSSEQSLLEMYRKNFEELGAAGEHQIKEDLADAMIESPGTKDVGGRCIILSVKPQPMQRVSATPSPIAKVVNPLGTVVTVHSEDEIDHSVPEDIVIYENCDEELFRPIVSSKTMSHHYNKNCNKVNNENIMTRSLQNNTEITVKVLDKNEDYDDSHPSSWDDLKVQDIKGNVKVLVRESEISDILVPKKFKETYQKVNEKNLKKNNDLNKNTELTIKSSIIDFKTDAVVNSTLDVNLDLELNDALIETPTVKEQKDSKMLDKKEKNEKRTEILKPNTINVNSKEISAPVENEILTKETNKIKEKINIKDNKKIDSFIDKDPIIIEETKMKPIKNKSPVESKLEESDIKKDMEKYLSEIEIKISERTKSIAQRGNIQKKLLNLASSELDDIIHIDGIIPTDTKPFTAKTSSSDTERINEKETKSSQKLPFGISKQSSIPISKSSSSSSSSDLQVENIDTINISEDNEKLKKKSLMKLRKPKTKLGVKITKPNETVTVKTDDDIETFLDADCEPSSIFSQRSYSDALNKKSIQQNEEEEEEENVDTATETYSTFTLTLPSKKTTTYSNVIIENNSSDVQIIPEEKKPTVEDRRCIPNFLQRMKGSKKVESVKVITTDPDSGCSAVETTTESSDDNKEQLDEKKVHKPIINSNNKSNDKKKCKRRK